MTSMPRVFKFQKKFGFFFVILVPFEILSLYPNIDSSHCLIENVQWIIKKTFQRKIYDLITGFSQNFLGFIIFVQTC